MIASRAPIPAISAVDAPATGLALADRRRHPGAEGADRYEA